MEFLTHSYIEEVVGGLPHVREFTIACHVAKNKFIGSGSTKKAAKEQAAEAAYNALKDVPSPMSIEQVSENFTGALIHICRARNLPQAM